MSEAKVILSCGRYVLMVGEFALAMQGDLCRTGNIPESVLPPIPEDELQTASIGGKPIRDMPVEQVRMFRPEYWTKEMLQYVCNALNGEHPSGETQGPF